MLSVSASTSEMSQGRNDADLSTTHCTPPVLPTFSLTFIGKHDVCIARVVKKVMTGFDLHESRLDSDVRVVCSGYPAQN